MALSLFAPYSFIYNPDSSTYHFDTDNDIDFTVYFALDATWFPSTPQIWDEVYTFGFWTNKSGGKDPRIMVTIGEILKKHFSNNEHSILTFICDDDDQKQVSRMRKFNGWFQIMERGDIVKLDKDVEFDGKTKHTSIIMHSKCRHMDIVKTEYLNADPDVTAKILSQ